MNNASIVIESQYSLAFREQEAQELGRHIKHRHSVVLIGMKRVGISNFLRFFLYHNDIIAAYLGTNEKHLFIPVDLHDLVEREMFPFWTLTLKRVVDAASRIKLAPKLQKQIETLFLESIQTQDAFYTIDSLKKSLEIILSAGFVPTLFYLRFDRVTHFATTELFANLQGLREATSHKLAYVVTSARSLDVLAPLVFSKQALAASFSDMYIKPARTADMQIIYKAYKSRYSLVLSEETEAYLFELVGGYVQYLQLALILLHENGSVATPDALLQLLSHDERIAFQSEELWESLSASEQATLRKIVEGNKVTHDEKDDARYLFKTGFIADTGEKQMVFSPLFASYVAKREEISKETIGTEFSKKEHLLFSLLEQNKGAICEREKIVEAVWPEVEAFGVSDWAIDRLVARLRQKLREKKSLYEIVTVRTRGYKLVTKSV